MANENGKRPTPLLDELETGPWPSFVTEIRKTGDVSPMCDDLLGQLELSYQEKKGHWKHGGMVGVRGYGGGVIGRYSDVPEQFPEVAHFHTIRVNQPAAWFYSSEALRTLCGIWERHGSGLTNMHGSTGDIVFLGTKTDELEPAFKELTEAGFDLGGSGSCLRTPSCCVGQARCEWACFDAMKLCNDLTQSHQDEMHRPAFPYKFKIKCSGCPNDCVAAAARADLSVIGTWKDEIQQDDAGRDRIRRRRPGHSEGRLRPLPHPLHGVGKRQAHDREPRVRALHALHQRHAQGSSAGQGARGRDSDRVQSPHRERRPAFFGAGSLRSRRRTCRKRIEELLKRMWEFWDEYGENRERVGELIQRVGMANFLEGIGLDPAPEMVTAPRDNPFIFFQEQRGGPNDTDTDTESQSESPISVRRITRSSCPRSSSGTTENGSSTRLWLRACSAT